MLHKVTCFLILYSKISLSESLDPYNDGPYPPEHRFATIIHKQTVIIPVG